MFISEEEVLRRLESGKNLGKVSVPASRPTLTVVPKEPKRNEPRVDDSVRIAAAVLVRSGATAPEVARELHLTENQVHGAVASPCLRPRVEASIARVRELALDRLMLALGLLDEDKLSACSAKDLSTITANMSRVLDKTNPRDEGARVNLVIYAPQLRQENHFRTLDV